MKRNGRQAASGYSVSKGPDLTWAGVTDNSDGTVTVTVTANDGPEERAAKVTVTGDSGKPAEVSVTQAGSSEAA